MYGTFVQNKCFDKIRGTPWTFHYLVVEAYIDGLEHLSDEIDRQSATQHLLATDNLLVVFKTVAGSGGQRNVYRNWRRFDQEILYGRKSSKFLIIAQQMKNFGFHTYTTMREKVPGNGLLKWLPIFDFL